MCLVKEHEQLQYLNSWLVHKYGDAQVIESKYRKVSPALKVLTKVPPMIDRTLQKQEESVICNLDSTKQKATFVKVGKHFVKSSSACGAKVIQNFYVPAGCLGETMELFADVQRRVNRNGMVSYVINYYEIKPGDVEAKTFKLKIGTPKRYPNEHRRIALPNGNAITFIEA